MSDKIKPALTPSEWREELRFSREWSVERLAAGDNPHGAAARALYGQPFGFTREDVTRIKRMVTMAEESVAQFMDEDVARWLDDMVGLAGPWLDLADRIEALLPPEA